MGSWCRSILDGRIIRILLAQIESGWPAGPMGPSFLVQAQSEVLLLAHQTQNCLRYFLIKGNTELIARKIEAMRLRDWSLSNEQWNILGWECEPYLTGTLSDVHFSRKNSDQTMILVSTSAKVDNYSGQSSKSSWSADLHLKEAGIQVHGQASWERTLLTHKMHQKVIRKVVWTTFARNQFLQGNLEADRERLKRVRQQVRTALGAGGWETPQHRAPVKFTGHFLCVKPQSKSRKVKLFPCHVPSWRPQLRWTEFSVRGWGVPQCAVCVCVWMINSPVSGVTETKVNVVLHRGTICGGCEPAVKALAANLLHTSSRCGAATSTIGDASPSDGTNCSEYWKILISNTAPEHPALRSTGWNITAKRWWVQLSQNRSSPLISKLHSNISGEYSLNCYVFLQCILVLWSHCFSPYAIVFLRNADFRHWEMAKRSQQISSSRLWLGLPELFGYVCLIPASVHLLLVSNISGCLFALRSEAKEKA